MSTFYRSLYFTLLVLQMCNLHTSCSTHVVSVQHGRGFETLLSHYSFSFCFFFTRKVVCSFAYLHVANWNTTRTTSEEACLLLLISEEDALVPCSLHSAPQLLWNKEASWSLYGTSLMCLAPVMSRDSSILMAWFYRQIYHGSLFLRPCLRLYTGDTAVPLQSNSNSNSN